MKFELRFCKLLVLSFLISFFLIDIAFAQTVTLNQYGHIVITEERAYPAPLTFNAHPTNQKLSIADNGSFTMSGNGFRELESGYLALKSYEGAIGTQLQKYDLDGQLLVDTRHPRTINLRISENEHYAAFFDGADIVRINLLTAQESRFGGQPVFHVSNSGTITTYDEHKQILQSGDESIPFSDRPRAYAEFDHRLLLFTENDIYELTDSEVKLIHTFDGRFFNRKVVGSNLYYVASKSTEKIRTYRMFVSDDLLSFTELQSTNIERPEGNFNEHIRCPLNYHSDTYQMKIGNTYGEIQQYGDNNSAYLHPGIDILGDAGDPVYAVQDGVVKAVLTIGSGGENDIYWRVAIANEDTDEESLGYLYAHLRLSSITVAEGDSVRAGEQIGELVSWPVYNFTHIHFARIKDSGTTWTGNWWTVDNPLRDMDGAIDNQAPVFNTFAFNQYFQFLNSSNQAVSPDDIHGSVRIITNVYDYINTDWRVDVDSLLYRIYPTGNPYAPVIDEVALTFDFPLDTYADRTFDNIMLNTIYNRSGQYFTIGNYQERAFYHILTNSWNSGPLPGNRSESTGFIDTELFEDGTYTLEATAINAQGGRSSQSMEITINNTERPIIPVITELHQNYPNPFNSMTTITFDLPHALTVSLKVYDITGALVRTLVDEVRIAGVHEIPFDATALGSGMYFYVLEAGVHTRKSRAMIYLK